LDSIARMFNFILRRRRRVLQAMVILLFVPAGFAQSGTDSGWPNYGNDAGGTRYSKAHQIDRTSVTRLRVAWTYRTGAMEQKVRAQGKAAFEATPILVEKKLFLSTPYDQVIALDPRSGTRTWEFDPH